MLIPIGLPLFKSSQSHSTYTLSRLKIWWGVIPGQDGAQTSWSVLRGRTVWGWRGGLEGGGGGGGGQDEDRMTVPPEWWRIETDGGREGDSYQGDGSAYLSTKRGGLAGGA